MNSKITEKIQSTYDEQYSDKITKWRELGGKFKAQNILEVAGERRFKKVLEYGAGEGSILNFLDQASNFQELYAVEISDSGIDQIKKRKLKKLKEVKKFDGYSTDFQDQEFDLVYCSHVIEHVEHPRLVLREIKRISKFQIFEVPLDYSVGVDTKIDHFLAYGHINIFTPSLFKFLLKSEGFEMLNELHTDTRTAAIKFNWYQNLKKPKSLKNRMLLALRIPYLKTKRAILGKKRGQEYGYSAYTCLTQPVGDINIF